MDEFKKKTRDAYKMANEELCARMAVEANGTNRGMLSNKLWDFGGNFRRSLCVGVQ
jgi:hypothetical protein